MKIFVVERTANYDDHPVWRRVRSRDHTVYAGEPKHCPFVPDAIVSWGATLTDLTFESLVRWPTARLYCYNWDVYEWVWTRPRKEEQEGTPGRIDYVRYGELLKRAREIWVPSNCTGRRTTQWYGLTNWTRILSAIPYWDHSNVRDDGYALCCLREIPDPWWGTFERCCAELGIPYRSTRHECSEAKYRDAVAGCRFICAPLYELSTGGLSLMEAYYLGKPVLLSDSEWNGGRDYLGDRADYFRHGDEQNFKEQLMYVFGRGRRWDSDFKHYVARFSDERMADEILTRIEATS